MSSPSKGRIPESNENREEGTPTTPKRPPRPPSTSTPLMRQNLGLNEGISSPFLTLYHIFYAL